MVNYKVISNHSLPSDYMSPSWKSVPFEEITIEKNGHTYQPVAQIEKKYSKICRTARIALGVLVAFLSLGLALILSRSIRCLFNSKKSICFITSNLITNPNQTPLNKRLEPQPDTKKASQLNDEILDIETQKSEHLKNNRREFRALFKKIQVKLSNGEIPARRAIVKKSFPQLATLNLSDRQKKALDTLLKEKFIAQQLAKRPLFKMSQGEKTLYQFFKFPISTIEGLKVAKSLEQKSELILLKTSPLYEKSEKKFIQSVKQHIQNLAVEERLNQMIDNSDLKKHPNLKMVKDHFQNALSAIQTLNQVSHIFSKDLDSGYKEIISTRKEIRDCSDTVVKQLMKGSIDAQIYPINNRSLSDYRNHTLKPLLLNGIEKGVNEFAELLSTAVDQLTKQVNAGDFKAKYQNLDFSECTWYDQYKENYIKAFSQGLMEEEALTTGVCLAKTLKLIEQEMLNPDSPESELGKIIEITSEDRYLQTFYELDKKLSEKVLKKAGFKAVLSIDSYMNTKNINLVSQKLCDSIAKRPWDLTNGVGKISLSGHENNESWGHSLFFRNDKQRGIYRFFDINKGIFKFKTEKELLNFIKEFLPTFYPSAMYMKTDAMVIK